MKKNFTKSDLKSGMIIQLNNGKYYLFVEGILIGEGGQLDINDYKEDLSLSDFFHKEYFDIKKVYYKKYHSWGMGFNGSLIQDLTLIWERKKCVEYTMQEIADKLGIPVEQLRIKK